MEDFIQLVATHHKYWLFVLLMSVSFYIAIACTNLVKKLIGIAMFQTSVFLFCIAVGKIFDAPAPILDTSIKQGIYSNPLPQVLILTAIVVSVATAAVGYALIVRIKDAYHTTEEVEIYRLNLAELKAEEED